MSGPKQSLITPGFLGATILVIALFFFWGVSNSLNDVLIPQFRKAFQLGDFTSGLVQFATFIGYFVFAIPAALFMRRFGYRAAVVMGLVLFGTGALLFYPAAQLGEYHWFLVALFVVASGLSFLETSANPMIAVMGPPESADQRLNFAQAFNPLGTISGVFIGKTLILSDVSHSPEELRAMTPMALDGVARGRARLRQTTLPRHCLCRVALGAAGRTREVSARSRSASPKAARNHPAVSAVSRHSRVTGSACSRSSPTSARRSACGAS